MDQCNLEQQRWGVAFQKQQMEQQQQFALLQEQNRNQQQKDLGYLELKLLRASSFSEKICQSLHYNYDTLNIQYNSKI